MEEKTGLLKLGFVKNLKRNEKGQNCISMLSRLIGREIQLEEINAFIDSGTFNIEYVDKDWNVIDKESSTGLRFKLPLQDVRGNDVYWHFTKNGSNFIGVTWGGEKLSKSVNLRRYGYIAPSCWDKLRSISGVDITEANIGEYITSDIEYYNGAGHTAFPDGTIVTSESGKFVKFSTNISTSKGLVVGWFTKGIRGKFEGISWGIEADFKSAQKLR